MKIEDQVCSVELAKRLKELGVKQESAFYWDIIDKNCVFSGYGNVKENNLRNWCSAFTVAELGEMLPSQYLSCFRDETGWFGYNISPTKEWKEMYPCTTEANARAKMLIYLIENKIMEISE